MKPNTAILVRLPLLASLAFCVGLVLPAMAEDDTFSSAGGRLTPEQQKAIESTRVGTAPQMPAWMRGAPAAAPSSPDTLDPNQITRLQAELARQKSDSEAMARTHERLHAKSLTEGVTGKNVDSNSGSSGQKSGDFVENYLTVTGLIAGSAGDKPERGEAARKTRDRQDEARLTGVSDALLGGSPLDPLAALADRLGGVAAPSALVGALPGYGQTGRNPYLTQGASGAGAYTLGASGGLVAREPASNPYLAAATASPRVPTSYTPSSVAPASVPSTFATPPAPPPPPPPTALQRQKAEDDLRKRLYPNLDKF